MITLKLLSILFEYPSKELFEHKNELIKFLENSNELKLNINNKLIDFIQEYCSKDLLDVQEQYCEIFDRDRKTSLLLFEHVHGESRDRGQAMVNLIEKYQQSGLQINCRELPDHLPLYLEYLSTLQKKEITKGLSDIEPILIILRERLKQYDSCFFVLFDVLVKLSSPTHNHDKLRKNIILEKKEELHEDIDSIWEEEIVSFFSDKKNCINEFHRNQYRFTNIVTTQYLKFESNTHVGEKK